jgi:hemerythrin-like domain-containing protein
MKRHKSLNILSHDHQHSLALSLKLKYNKKPLSSSLKEEVRILRNELIEKFENEISKHFKLEETFLAPLFPQNEMIIRMLDEHKKIEEFYTKIYTKTEKWSFRQFREKLNLFGELLEQHIRFEERELFPMIEQSLTEEQLITLGKNLKKG